MRSSIKALLPEPETPEQILAEFKSLASDPTLAPELRAKSGQLAIFIEEVTRYEALWDKTAEELGIHKFFETLPSEEIAKYRALPEDGGEDALLEVIKERLMEPNRELFNKLPGWDEQDFLGHWCGVFRTALMKEYLRRRDQNENDDGRLIREILIQDDEEDRAAILCPAAAHLTNGLFFAGENRWHSEEAPAEAVVQMWGRICEYSRVSPVASNPKAIESFMTGSFNAVLEQSRSHVRTIVETENRRSRHQINEHADEGSAEPGTPKVLFELSHQIRPDQEQRVLFEQVLARAELSDSDKRMATLRYCEEWTQEELAGEFRVSQPQVCKRLKAARVALATALNDES